MKITTIESGPMGANCYIVETQSSAVIIDPGFMTAQLEGYLLNSRNKVKAVLLTHRHADHMVAVFQLSELLNVPIVVHKLDSECLFDVSVNLADLMPQYNFVPTKRGREKCVSDGDELSFGDIKIKVLHTPGHTVGGVCYIIDDKIFSGDTLFKGSVGRTDLPTGDFSQLKKSLEKLCNISKDREVYPGHGVKTRLSFEKQHNPYLSEFVSCKGCGD